MQMRSRMSMTRIRLRLRAVAVALLVAVPILTVPTASSAPHPGGSSPRGGDDLDELVEVVQPLVDDARADGVRVSVGLADISQPRGASEIVGSGQTYNPASVIKLALLATLMRQVDRGVLSLDAPVTVSPYMVVGGSGTVQDEDMPFTTTVGELARRMVVVSDNTATNVLFYLVGIPTVQELLDDLGLETMAFNRQMFPGELIDGENVIDTADTVELLRQMYGPRLLSRESRQQVLTWMSQQEVDTKFGAVLDDAPVAHKTGEDANVTHDVGYFSVPGRETVVAVFTEVTTTDNYDEAQRIGNPIVQEIGRNVYDTLER